LYSNGYIHSFVAFTSINQAGFILMGLVTMTDEGFVASVVYLVTYLVATALFLGVLTQMRKVYTNGSDAPIVRFIELRMLYQDKNDHAFSRRLDSLLLAFATWSMAGLPPLAGFFGKVAV
jgi:NADH-quinone oxidoreductase subunit N